MSVIHTTSALEASAAANDPAEQRRPEFPTSAYPPTKSPRKTIAVAVYTTSRQAPSFT